MISNCLYTSYIRGIIYFPALYIFLYVCDIIILEQFLSLWYIMYSLVSSMDFTLQQIGARGGQIQDRSRTDPGQQLSNQPEHFGTVREHTML